VNSKIEVKKMEEEEPTEPKEDDMWDPFEDDEEELEF
jgi:hypothetical protein